MEGTEEGLTQSQEGDSQEVVETTEVSSEDLQKQIQDLSAKIEEQVQTIKKQEKTLTSGQSRMDTLEQLHTRLDGLEEAQATILDVLEGNVKEPESPTKTRQEQLAERRKQQGAPREPQDPDAVKFFNFMESQGLKPDDSLIQEAVADNRSPKEALEYLRTKVKTADDAKVEKRAKELAANLKEQELKEKGLTASGAKGPSGSSSAWRDLSPGEKILKGVSQGK